MYNFSIDMRAKIMQMTGLRTDPHTHGRMTLSTPALIQALHFYWRLRFYFSKDFTLCASIGDCAFNGDNAVCDRCRIRSIVKALLKAEHYQQYRVRYGDSGNTLGIANNSSQCTRLYFALLQHTAVLHWLQLQFISS